MNEKTTPKHLQAVPGDAASNSPSEWPDAVAARFADISNDAHNARKLAEMLATCASSCIASDPESASNLVDYVFATMQAIERALNEVGEQAMAGESEAHAMGRKFVAGAS